MRCLEIFLLSATAFFGIVLFLWLVLADTNDLTPANTVRKMYRDYHYSPGADAFYKIHHHRSIYYTAANMCRRDGAELISSDEQDLLVAHILHTKRDYRNDKDVATKDIITFVAKADMDDDCKGVNITGDIVDVGCYSSLPSVICKIPARNIHYDENCKMHYTSDKPLFTPNKDLGSCYYMSDYSTTWSLAERDCERHSGHLAVINSQEEAAFIEEFLEDNSHLVRSSSNTKYVSIGFSYSHREGSKRIFTSVLGRTLADEEYEVWTPGEPNNWQDREDCGSWFVDSPGLNDVPCDFYFAFICEKEMDCECCTPDCLRKAKFQN